jgi:two-component system nitrogen regulation sensor histidine kinase NtrY
VYRYGPWAAWGLGLIGLMGLGRGGYVLARRLRRAERTRTRVLEASEDGLLLVGPEGTIEYENESARAYLERDGSAANDLSRAAPALASLIEGASPAGPPQERTLPLEVPGQNRPLQAHAVPLSEDGRPHWLIRLRDPAAPSEDSYRAWGLMARRVAHDLKNPLTSMLLTLQRLQMEYRDRAPDVADDLDVYTARIEERIEHLRRMTKNFMKFIGAETSALHRTDFNAFLREQAPLLRTGLPPDIRLTLKLDADVPPVNLDAEQIQSALENLVANAVNALPDGGQITLSTHLERRLRFDPDAPARDFAVLEVLDTGEGMDTEPLDRLFEPGFTTREEGTGLGLAIVQKIVSDHRGHLEVESEVGVGTAVSLYFPVADGDASSDTEQSTTVS